MEREVTLMEMLQAREARAMAQQAMLEERGLTVISFCMNIAGPVKNSPIIRRAFREGLHRLSAALIAAGFALAEGREVDEATGCEALWAVAGPGRAVKELCVELEDQDALGRLFDLDVLSPGHGPWSREELGRRQRRCLVCGKEGKGCASRRLHTLEELKGATDGILEDYFAAKDAKTLAAQAGRALLYEVCTTPKPGLVDRFNNGSHRDMDVFTFLDSTAALLPYFERAVTVGMETASLPPQETFRRLRREGVLAEEAMLRATGGVNTHKGAVFSLGTVCAAAGRLWRPDGPCREPERLMEECAAMAGPAVEAEFAAVTPENAVTAGRRLYLERGLRGIRGEVADGLPSVREVGLPVLRAALDQGRTLEQAGVAVLIALMARVVDTNLLARGGEEGRVWASELARRALEGNPLPGGEEAAALDRALMGRNLSPGGCADLLAITYFLHALEEEKER